MKARNRAVWLGVVGVAALVLVATAVQAGTVTSNYKLPFERIFYLPAADEYVLVTGTVHYVVHITENANGIHMKAHANPQGLDAVGLTTGTAYRVTGVSSASSGMQSEGFPIRETLINNFHILGPGPGNNFLLHSVSHVTVNANGQVTVDFERITIQSK